MIRILAYAKLNLSLSVIGRREDGFHQIDSIIQKIDLADQITVRPTGNSLVVENDLDIAPQEDLVWLAARLILDEKHLERGFYIRVSKRIPPGAGLGGGSSDAATVLWAMNLLTPPAIPVSDLLRLSEKLGFDVPLFFWGGLVRVKGRGEDIAPVFPSRKEHFVIVVPPIHSNTG
jgi:4-diphosphocytidyl-2-C-methyl-D-erythritol kinase